MAQAQVTTQETTQATASAVVNPMAKFDLTKLMAEHKTKSAVIRHLAGQGCTRSQIAVFMNIRYQHVRNVLTQPLKQVVAVTEKPAEQKAA